MLTFTYCQNDLFILKGENDRFLELNFGSFEIRLGEKELDDEVRFHVRDINNKICLERVLFFRDLKQSLINIYDNLYNIKICRNLKHVQEIWRPIYPNWMIFAVNWLKYTFFDERFRVLWPLMAAAVCLSFYILFSFYLTCCFVLRKIKLLIYGVAYLIFSRKGNNQNKLKEN